MKTRDEFLLWCYISDYEISDWGFGDKKIITPHLQIFLRSEIMKTAMYPMNSPKRTEIENNNYIGMKKYIESFE